MCTSSPQMCHSTMICGFRAHGAKTNQIDEGHSIALVMRRQPPIFLHGSTPQVSELVKCTSIYSYSYLHLDHRLDTHLSRQHSTASTHYSTADQCKKAHGGWPSSSLLLPSSARSSAKAHARVRTSAAIARAHGPRAEALPAGRRAADQRRPGGGAGCESARAWKGRRSNAIGNIFVVSVVAKSTCSGSIQMVRRHLFAIPPALLGFPFFQEICVVAHFLAPRDARGLGCLAIFALTLVHGFPPLFWGGGGGKRG